jgi:hypothetical protein
MRLTFDLELLRFFAAWADPEKPGAMAGANAIGSAAGTTRNAAARNATRRLRDIISSQAGMNSKVPYHGCRLSVTFKTGHYPFQIRPLTTETGKYPHRPKNMPGTPRHNCGGPKD